jgi:phosphoribosyl-AMP cyclohydrolase
MSILDDINFNAEGLVPVIAQCGESKQVLMMAWMDKQALQKTLETKEMYYWSRSRGALWKKGETSGQVQALKELIVDCDNDTLLALVEQRGVACHTGRKTCFYSAIRDGELVELLEPEVDPKELYGDL